VQYVANMAAKDGALPIFVVYNVPGRDCGQHSAGGLKTADLYRRWIRKVAAGIGENGAVVVVEPDSLGLVDNCLTPEQVELEDTFLFRSEVTRRYALEEIASHSLIWVNGRPLLRIDLPDRILALPGEQRELEQARDLLQAARRAFEPRDGGSAQDVPAALRRLTEEPP
jgi:hypothetical protein